MNCNFDLEQKKVIWQAAKILRTQISDDVARRWEDNMLDAKLFHDDLRAAVVAENAKDILWVGYAWESSFEGEKYWTKVFVKHCQPDADTILNNFTQWGKDRKIDTGGTMSGQLSKLEEEVWELFDAIQRDDDTETQDAIGDIIVVLAQVCLMKGWSVQECMSKAWDDIKDRKGEMVNGVFVKEDGQ